MEKTSKGKNQRKPAWGGKKKKWDMEGDRDKERPVVLKPNGLNRDGSTGD